MNLTPGLYVVGTPIGNLDDLTPRAARVLTTVDVVICEDTRRTGVLIARALEVVGGRRPAFVVGNEHTERARIPEIIDRVANGETVALVTDAGMPTVSDPGTALVAAVAEAGCPVHVVPGPSAVSAALAVSGLLSGRFVFEGFLPRKGQVRAQRLSAIATEERVVVLYEAPGRLVATLEDLVAACGPGRQLAVARELTKLHEEVVRASLAEAVAHFEASTVRGEIVIVVSGAPVAVVAYSDDDLTDLLKTQLAGGLSRRDAVGSVVSTTGAMKRRVYELANSIGSAEEAGSYE